MEISTANSDPAEEAALTAGARAQVRALPVGAPLVAAAVLAWV